MSRRFGKPIRLTLHAKERMARRNIDLITVIEIIETGTVRDRGGGHLLIFKRCERRDDNLLCAAVIDADALIVKTVMHHFVEDVQ